MNFEEIKFGTPVGLEYNAGDEVISKVCLFINKDTEKNINYFIDVNGIFGFSDNFINRNVKVTFDNLDFSDLQILLKEVENYRA
ncbi:MAG: hypothetical protein IJH34_11765 [Romboutsia sp.]|nr:hypothetical protein [Romboutsia sp.]